MWFRIEIHGPGLIKVLSQHMPKQTKENHENPQSWQPESWMSFEPLTFQANVFSKLLQSPYSLTAILKHCAELL
jgi:hypothetical protein